MKKIAAIILATFALIGGASAADVAKFRQCEKDYRAETKAAKLAAPAGFIPMPNKDRRPAFILACLDKETTAAK